MANFLENAVAGGFGGQNFVEDPEQSKKDMLQMSMLLGNILGSLITKRSNPVATAIGTANRPKRMSAEFDMRKLLDPNSVIREGEVMQSPMITREILEQIKLLDPMSVVREGETLTPSMLQRLSQKRQQKSVLQGQDVRTVLDRLFK